MRLGDWVLRWSGWVFDGVRDGWGSGRGRRLRALLLVVVFFGSIGVVELGRLGLLPGGLGEAVGGVSHLAAIAWTVSVLLVFEVVQLVLTLERSVAGAMGAQLQLYSLILMRDAFVGLESFGEPLEIAGRWDVGLAMAADAAGALVLFLVALWYGRLQRHDPITVKPGSRDAFVAVKKLVALVLLGVIVWLLVYDAWRIATGAGAIRLFDLFFTTLVFADVLLALVSLGFSQRYAVVFRNFGFAFVAVMLRLALTSDVFYRPAIGVAAGLFAVGVTAVYNLSSPVPHGDGGDGGDGVADGSEVGEAVDAERGG